MKLALAQIRVEQAAVSANRRRASEAVRRAAAEGCDLVVLPELFTVGYFAFEAYARTAEGLDGATISDLSTLAADHDIGILAGSFVEDLAAIIVGEREDCPPSAVSATDPARRAMASTWIGSSVTPNAAWATGKN